MSLSYEYHKYITFVKDIGQLRQHEMTVFGQPNTLPSHFLNQGNILPVTGSLSCTVHAIQKRDNGSLYAIHTCSMGINT